MRNFILAAVCLIFAFLPLAIGNLVPMHDAMTVFGLFHYFYTQFFAYNHVAQWSPYDFYGQPSHFAQLVAISPLSYLAFVVGKTLHITDVLWLFKCVMGLEVMVFASGLWRLSSKMYRSSLAVWLVTIIGASTAIWVTQPFFNFRIYYLWPWVLLALINFAEKRTLGNLAWGSIWLLAGMLGNLPYFAGVWLLVAVLFTGALLFCRENQKGPLSLEGYQWMVLCGFFAAVLFLFMKGLSDGVTLMAPDRLADASSSLKQFLNYGDTAQFGTWIRSTLGLGPLFLWGLRDIAPFVGMVTAGLCLWSLIAAARPVSRAVNTVLIVLMLIIFIPFVGSVFYFLPLVKYYRHLSLLGGFAKFFIILSAGFGWDDLYRRFSGRHRSWLIVLILFTAGEQCIYQWRLWQEITHINPKIQQLQSVVGVTPMPWQEQRTFEPQRARSHQAQLLVEAAALLNGGRFTTDYDFIQWDTCNSPYRRDWAVGGVKDLEAVNPSILGVLGGCQSPKVRLVGRAVAMSKEDYLRLLSWVNIQMLGVAERSPQNMTAALMEVNQKLNSFIAVPELTSLPDHQNNGIGGKVEVVLFDSNEIAIIAHVDASPGAWLVYADGYHKGWKALMDGKPVNVIEADRAFKAVWVPRGEHQIKFNFFNGPETVLSYILMFLGCLIAGLMIANLICIL